MYLSQLVSQRVWLLLLAIFGIVIAVSYATTSGGDKAILSVLDLLPMLFGLVAALGVASIQNSGMYNYFLSRYPHRLSVYRKVLSGTVLYYIVCGIGIFGICAVVSTGISMSRGGSIAGGVILFAVFRFIALVFFFSAFGASVAFIGRNLAVALLTYIGLVWLLPVVLVFLSLLRSGLGDTLTRYTIGSQVAIFAGSESSVAELGAPFLILMIWGVVAGVLGYSVFRGRS